MTLVKTHQLGYQNNPYAEGTGALSYINDSPEVLPVNLTATVNAGATSVALTDATVANNTLAYYRVTIYDQSGNSAVGEFAISNIAGGGTVNTTALNKNDKWGVIAEWAEPTTSLEARKERAIRQDLEGTKGSAVLTFDLRQLGGTLQVWAELSVNGTVTVANAVVSDTGTAAFGNVAQNATAKAKITFKNTGTNPLRILSIVKSAGDGALSTAFADTPSLPAVIAAGETAELQMASITTSATGAITPLQITINSNDPSNAVYVVNFSATIV